VTASIDEKAKMFRTVYLACNRFAKLDPRVATPAIASIRLLLIDAVGEVEQRRLVGLWNEEMENGVH
jgi:hypothetical protein